MSPASYEDMDFYYDKSEDTYVVGRPYSHDVDDYFNSHELNYIGQFPFPKDLSQRFNKKWISGVYPINLWLDEKRYVINNEGKILLSS